MNSSRGTLRQGPLVPLKNLAADVSIFKISCEPRGFMAPRIPKSL